MKDALPAGLIYDLINSMIILFIHRRNKNERQF